ncbi:hypothetical protein AAGS40_23260 [Paraburkholderia sp. PREW-6R]|uniref:hypothetical protein n=1 Tax=Paraburkholderia sp. PREW-6R TaxID=3141544 RepID=UPI0031F5979A
MSDPTTPNCAPAPVALPSCEEMMASAISAYIALMAGTLDVVKIKSMDSETEYSRRNQPALLELIRNLNQRCPCEASLSVLGVPAHRRAAQPNFVDRGWEGSFPVRRTFWY